MNKIITGAMVLSVGKSLIRNRRLDYLLASRVMALNSAVEYIDYLRIILQGCCISSKGDNCMLLPGLTRGEAKESVNLWNLKLLDETV